MLIGLHCGDSLGATLEFGPPQKDMFSHREIIGNGPFNWTPGAATDDTDLMLMVLKSIENTNSFSFEKLKKQLITWYDSKPLDIGNTTKKGIENLKLNLPLKDCGYKHPTQFGNGSLMRCAPLALYQGVDMNEVVITQCLMTHGHEICVKVDLFYIHLLRDLLSEQIFNQSGLIRFISSNSFLDITQKNQLLSDLDTPWEHLKTPGDALGTLSAGLWALNQSFSNLTPSEAVIAVANRGDDSDTCAAVAGALIGARYGESVFLDNWVSVIQKKVDINSEISRILHSL